MLLTLVLGFGILGNKYRFTAVKVQLTMLTYEWNTFSFIFCACKTRQTAGSMTWSLSLRSLMNWIMMVNIFFSWWHFISFFEVFSYTGTVPFTCACCYSGGVVWANKLLLSMASEVFRAMFYGDLATKAKGRCRVTSEPYTGTYSKGYRYQYRLSTVALLDSVLCFSKV
jgi:hypothetical protein